MLCKECIYFDKGYCKLYEKSVVLTDWNKNKRCSVTTEINKTEEVLK